MPTIIMLTIIRDTKSMINEFAQKYPDTENTHNVKLSEEDLVKYLQMLEKHYNTLNKEGYKVPKVTYHEKTESSSPHITFEQIENCMPLSQYKDLSDNKKRNILAQAHGHAKKIMETHNMVIYNRNDNNIFYDASKDEFWLYDLRQTTWDDVKKYYFQVQRKPRADKEDDKNEPKN